MACSTLNLSRKAARINGFIRQYPQLHASGILFLYLVKHSLPDDGFMGMLYHILRKFSTIFPEPLVDWIFYKVFLKNEGTYIDFIRKQISQTAGAPELSASRLNALCRQPAHDFTSRCTIQIAFVDASNNLSLVRHHLQAISAPPITIYWNTPIRNSLCITFTLFPLDVIRQALTFCLCKGCQDRQHQLSVTAKRTDVFLLKTHLYI